MRPPSVYVFQSKATRAPNSSLAMMMLFDSLFSNIASPCLRERVFSLVRLLATFFCLSPYDPPISFLSDPPRATLALLRNIQYLSDPGLLPSSASARLSYLLVLLSLRHLPMHRATSPPSVSISPLVPRTLSTPFGARIDGGGSFSPLL